MKQSTAIADFYRQIAPSAVHASSAVHQTARALELDTQTPGLLHRWRRNRVTALVDDRIAGPAGTPGLACFQKCVDEQMQAARATATGLSCLVTRITGSDPDVTGLEPIHAAKLIADFARFLVEIRPDQGIICSQGAGAFAILAPRTGKSAALQLAHRVLWEIHDRAWRIADCYVDLTCSIGVASLEGLADRDLVDRAAQLAELAAGRGDPIAAAK